jgi:nitrogen fixation/metabolism regulation signal transduction histidine kinase
VRRVAAALLVTALLPLLAAMALADKIIESVADVAFQDEFVDHLDRSLGLYKELVDALKHGMREEARAIAAAAELGDAVEADSRADVEQALARALDEHPALLRLEVQDDEGQTKGARDRGRPLAEGEREVTVPMPLRGRGVEWDHAPMLVAVFAVKAKRIEEMEAAQQFAQAYKSFAERHRGEHVQRPYLMSFAVLLGITVLFAMITAILVVRPVIQRINRLAAATKPVAEGDLSVRVDDKGKDEIGDLARAFDHMLEALGESRARIEFLKRVGEWQQVARRLAHEIKNPLTPIQLAVEECGKRYQGDDPSFKGLLRTTLDIVTEEVASLRRLVGEFAEFARLPRAALREGDLAEFLRDQQPRLEREAPLVGDGQEVEVALDIADGPMPVGLDRTMFYRVLANLVANAAQAAASKSDEKPRVVVTARTDRQTCVVDVEDNGPGVPQALRDAIFDPYMTTKKGGTGLGLTIVKKVIIDHGGHVEVGDSPLGGARFRIRLPRLGTSASDAAMTQSAMSPISA